MKYKFYGEPNMLVKERKRVYFENKLQLKPIFRFDANGEYITDDERLIEKLKSRFSCVPVEETLFEPTEEPKKFKCKQCSFETDNKGLLLAHYREKHPKE